MGQLALTGLAPKEKADGSSLYNLTRTLGGSIGIAIIGTLIVNRERFHFERFGESITRFSLATQLRLSELTAGFSGRAGGFSQADPAHRATAALAATLTQQSFVAAFDDASIVLGFVTLAILLLLPIFRVQRPKAPAAN
jgi:MFS transporter, DHA2 family, multidrug resistance protein